MTKIRNFKILDIDCESIIIIEKTQKEVLSWLDQYIENLENDWFNGADETFEILYKDGKEDYIDEEYDGHWIRRNNIASIVYNNADAAIVYGGFKINEYGVVTASKDIEIAEENLAEMA